MKKKVKITTYRGAHNLAQCYDCEWEYSNLNSREMSNECCKHVRRTGHYVIREVGNSARYSLEIEE